MKAALSFMRRNCYIWAMHALLILFIVAGLVLPGCALFDPDLMPYRAPGSRDTTSYDIRRIYHSPGYSTVWTVRER